MKASFILKWLVSCTFFLVLARVVQTDAFVEMLRQADPVYVGVSFGLSFVMLGLSCAKWHILLRHQGRTINFIRLYRIYLIGYFYTNLLPSNVGGDVSRSYLAGREIGSQSDAAISVFMERLTGLLVLLFLVMVAPCLNPKQLYPHAAVWLPSLGSLVLLLILLWIYRVPDPLGVLQRFGGCAPGIFLWMREKAAAIHGRLVDSIQRLARDVTVVWIVGVMTLLFYLLTWINVWVTFKAFGVQIAIVDVAAILPTAMIVSMVPIVPLAGLGLAEGVYVYYFALLGVAPAGSLAMGLLLRSKLMVLGVVGLFVSGCPRYRASPET